MNTYFGDILVFNIGMVVFILDFKRNVIIRIRFSIGYK